MLDGDSLVYAVNVATLERAVWPTNFNRSDLALSSKSEVQGSAVLASVEAVADLSGLPLVGTDVYLSACSVRVGGGLKVDLEPVVCSALLVDQDEIFTRLGVEAAAYVGVYPPVTIEVCDERNCGGGRHLSNRHDGWEVALPIVQQNHVLGLTAVGKRTAAKDVEVRIIIEVGQRDRCAVVDQLVVADDVEALTTIDVSSGER